jgi:chemotaxis protein methyltransferase CheR
MTMATTSGKEFAFTDEDFHFLASLVAEKTGIVLAEHKKSMVYSRLARRLRALGLSQFSQYRALLSEDSGEMINFVNAVTTNVTHFFREGHHFEHLKNAVLSPMATKPGAKKFRLWSAGCSMGMEPYSIAMTMCESIPALEGWDARILATDIDTNVLETGTKGSYSAEVLEDIPEPYRRKYTFEEGGKVNMADRLKRLIAFKQLNLLDPWPMKGPFDVIFCRNVVIYFSKDLQRVIFDKYANMLKPGGWLYIGHSENLFNVCNRFESMGKTIYRKIR